MLSIRLMPVGKKHQRSFRIVVDERRHKLKGKNIEDLGWYNPHTNSFNLNNERILHWINHGAQPTDTTHNLLVRSGVIRGKKVAVHGKTKKKSVDAPADAEAMVDKEAVKDEKVKTEETLKAGAEGSEPKNEAVTSGDTSEEKLETDPPQAEKTEGASVAEAEDKKQDEPAKEAQKSAA